MRDRFTLTPLAYRRIAYVALASLGLIVLTGAGVRLTGSGLGCPNWPKCGGGYVAPLETHAVIEYGNRLLSGLVGLVMLAAGLLAWRWAVAAAGRLRTSPPGVRAGDETAGPG